MQMLVLNCFCLIFQLWYHLRFLMPSEICLCKHYNCFIERSTLWYYC
uniref:Uncharacterized protein n=1 Tax=Arundo donax TaxID=35708 RepID=A0A0A8ZCF0_ARUDO